MTSVIAGTPEEDHNQANTSKADNGLQCRGYNNSTNDQEAQSSDLASSINSGTQTDTTLPSTARSITWIPVADEIQPVHDVDMETMLEMANQHNEEQEALAELAQYTTHGDVNDIDSIEIQQKQIGRDDKEEEKTDHDSKFVSTSIYAAIVIMQWMITIAIMVYATSVKPDLIEEEDEFPELTKYLDDMPTQPTPLQSTASHNTTYGSWLVPLVQQDSELGVYALSKDNDTNIHKVFKVSGNLNKIANLKLKMKRGITLDSGSHHNVMPKRLVNSKNIRPSAGSRAGMFYTAANKGRIANEGEVDFKFQTMEGYDEEMCFQIAEVNKALAAIADRVDHNYRVVFDKNMATGLDASYMLNKTSGRVIKTTRVGNVWVIEAIISVEDAGEESFVRQG